MKYTFFIVSTILLVQSFAFPFDERKTDLEKLDELSSTIPQIYHEIVPELEGSLCPACVQLGTQALNQLLNIILNVGVIGSCGDLCTMLSEKSGSQPLGLACSLVCDIVGVKYFIAAIQKSDLDPIYYCELLNICPINDKGDVTITDLTVSPESGPQGVYLIGLKFRSENGTGTGQLAIAIETVDGVPQGGSFLLQAMGPGAYNGNIKLNTVPDPKCNPEQKPCEQWLPGEYTAKIAICNGECGSRHPHSRIYDQGAITFTIEERSLDEYDIGVPFSPEDVDGDDEKELDYNYDYDDYNNLIGMKAFIDDEIMETFPVNDYDYSDSEDIYSQWLLEDIDENETEEDEAEVDDVTEVYPSWLFDDSKTAQDDDENKMNEDEIINEIFGILGIDDQTKSLADIFKKFSDTPNDNEVPYTEDQLVSGFLQMKDSDILAMVKLLFNYANLLLNDPEFLGTLEDELTEDEEDESDIDDTEPVKEEDKSDVFPYSTDNDSEEDDEPLLDEDDSDSYPDWLNSEEDDESPADEDSSDIYNQWLNSEEDDESLLGEDASVIYPYWLDSEEDDKPVLDKDNSDVESPWLNEEEDGDRLLDRQPYWFSNIDDDEEPIEEETEES